MCFIEQCTESDPEWLSGYRMAVSVLVFKCRGCVAGRELRVTGAAQHHEGGSDRVSLAWEKIQIQNWKYSFYRIRTAFAPS